MHTLRRRVDFDFHSALKALLLILITVNNRPLSTGRSMESRHIIRCERAAGPDQAKLHTVRRIIPVCMVLCSNCSMLCAFYRADTSSADSAILYQRSSDVLLGYAYTAFASSPPVHLPTTLRSYVYTIYYILYILYQLPCWELRPMVLQYLVHQGYTPTTAVLYSPKTPHILSSSSPLLPPTWVRGHIPATFRVWKFSPCAGHVPARYIFVICNCAVGTTHGGRFVVPNSQRKSISCVE